MFECYLLKLISNNIIYVKFYIIEIFFEYVYYYILYREKEIKKYNFFYKIIKK